MSGLARREQLELWLRVELENAQEEFWKATPKEKSQASEKFQQALETFTGLILRGELPKNCIGTREAVRNVNYGTAA